MAEALTIKKTILKDGASYSVSENGAENIQTRYQVLLNRPIDVSAELLTEIKGIPEIGTEHPQRPGYFVSHYEVSQPSGAAKHTLNVTVKYAPITSSGGGEGEEEEDENQVEEWGWSDATSSKELVEDVTGKPVVNSAGDPFDSVPTVDSPAPVFTKVMKFRSRQMSLFQYFCTVNAKSVTIGGDSFPPCTLLCTVSETRLLGNENWNYQYTVKLRYKSNKASIAYDSPEECGWDVPIQDRGMREFDSATGKLVFIQTFSRETGTPVEVTSAELLNGNGQAVNRDPGTSSDIPVYNFRFQAYPRKDWPSWFYSEPPLSAPV